MGGVDSEPGESGREEEKVALLAKKWVIPRDEARRLLDGEDDG